MLLNFSVVSFFKNSVNKSLSFASITQLTTYALFTLFCSYANASEQSKTITSVASVSSVDSTFNKSSFIDSSVIDSTFKEPSLDQLKFTQLSTLNGLSNSNVFSITQDHQGFIWFATADGLNRFDGNNFVIYRHDINNEHSIANNFIRKIFIDSENTLWVGTENGLSRYNAEMDNFDNFKHIDNDETSLKDNVIWDIYQNKPSDPSVVQATPLLWVSTTEGLHTLSPKASINEIKFNRVNIRNYNDRIREIKTIFQDKEQNYWLGSFDQGIHLLSKNLNYIGSLKKANKFNLSITANALFDMKIIDNHYWLATDNGLYIIDDRYQLTSHLTDKAITNNSSQLLLSNNVRSIAQFDENQVWLATHNGLNTINLFNNEIKSYQNDNNSTVLSENWLMDIYRDKNDNMWLASYGGGLNKYSPLLSLINQRLEDDTLENYRVESFTETSDGTIWFSTPQQGLFSLGLSQEISQIKLPFNEIVDEILVSNNDNILLYTKNNNLFEYTINTQKLTQHTNWYKETSSTNINQLLMIQNTIFSLTNDDSLIVYDTNTKRLITNEIIDTLKINNIQKDQHDNLWLIAKDNKVYLYDYQNDKLQEQRIKLPSELGKSKNFEVSENWLWFNSEVHGLSLVNKTNDQQSLFNIKSQLKGDTISSIIIDEKENAWLATNSGIAYITPKTGDIVYFDIDLGIKTPQFYDLSALKTKSGQIFLGSPKGLYHFIPEALLQVKQQISKPIFTDLFIINKKVDVKNNSSDIEDSYTINKQLNYLDTLELAYLQSPVSFEFISPNPRLLSQLKYRYRLMGLEKNWIDAASNTTNNRATYTNLSPGNYIFEVQAYDVYDQSKSEKSQLKIHISPPWWLSTSMLLVYGTLTILFCIYIFQQYRNKRLYHSQIKESEERLKLSLWGSGDEMWDWNIITDKIYRSNIWGILDFPQDGTRSKSDLKNNQGGVQTNIHHHDIARVKAALEEHFSQNTDHFEATYRVKNKDNQWVWILDRGKIVERDDNNKPSRMTGTLKDISQIKKAEERLKLFARCIQNISDAVIIYDRQFIAVDINKAYQRITGTNRKQSIGRTLAFNQYPKSFTQNIKQHLVSKGSWHGEIENIRADGSKYLTDLNIDIIHDENNKISHFVGVFSDITTRKETEAELRKLASSDTLTGLPNRSYFQANQARLVKNNIHHALLVFDLDNFKKINDSMGHQVGDAILCQVAKRMLTLGRKQDTVYRLGGDEFSIILEGTNDIHTITSLAKEILRTVAIPFKIKNQEIVLYSSIGIVLSPEDGNSGHELLKNADTAMYHAKGSGGNKYQFFSDSMNKEAVKRLQIESLIRHGLKDDSFSVFYQPKIEISTGKIAGMEALVRFETPSKGVISPVVFIPVSEETGQIIDIGEIVLRKACYATKKWVDAGLFDGRVAVNLSAVQFTQANLVSQIANILRESKLPAKHLELEITEGTVMNSPQEAIDTMLQIRALGIHLSLDDFGTGYSSLAYLKKFPLNTLKIDKAFVDDIEESEQGRNMVATIVTIAHNLGMDVVAEGVETNQQLSFLSGLRCEQLQGYLYSKPLATEHFQKYLLSHQITKKSTAFN